MIRIILGLCLAFFLFSCQGDVKKDNVKEEVEVTPIQAPISTKAVLSQSEFDSLHLWELGRTLMTPYYEILQANNFQDSLLYLKLNESQRQLYYFWQFDNTVSENGFSSIFPLRNTTHIEEVLAGLTAWEASETRNLLEAVIEDFKKNEQDFIKMAIGGQSQEFAKKHNWYNRFTKVYLEQQESVMQKAEAYIRAQPDAFIVLK